MEMTRSEFLRTMAVGAGSAIAGASGVAQAADVTSEKERGVSRRFTKDDFTKHLRSNFRVLDKTSPNVIEVELVEVKAGRSSDRHEQFSILFHGPVEPQLSQQVYAVEHAELGTFELFLVPVGADDKSVSYEAVFSYLLT